MLQAIVKKGKVIAENIPAPNVSDEGVLIKVVCSCISSGTELSGVKESGKSIIKRALEQPEQVKQVLTYFKDNGLSKTYQRVKGTLDGGKQTGYSISGIVIATGKNVTKFHAGQRVAAAGAGIANHAEYVDVPSNLVMSIPDSLDFDKASTVTLGGIALQGVRRCDLKLGEICVVLGAGILGLIAQQLLQAAGVRVIVIDLDNERLKTAKELGAEKILNPKSDDVITEVENLSSGHGADAVIFTAATHSNEPLSQAFKMCRKKGKVVLVGVSGMEIKRGDIYKKELDFLISTSYGPGRYDANYEQKGLDYPYSYVRWTENRNMTEYLRLVSSNQVDLDKLIAEKHSIEEVEKAYANLKPESGPAPLISILEYDTEEVEAYLGRTFNSQTEKVVLKTDYKKNTTKTIQIGLVGAGSFARGMHLPNITKLSDKFQLRAVHNRTGFNAKTAAEQYGAEYATTDIQELLNDDNIDLLMITTRHDSHAELALQGLNAGKHVFVEKPLCINQKQLEDFKDFYKDGIANKPLLMVGFNRRFSKYASEIKKHIEQRNGPMLLRYRMNAGYIPADHWVHEDGGRIIGEGCHLIDLMRYFTGSKVISANSENLNPKDSKFSSVDNTAMTFKYDDRSVANIDYFSCGNKQISKEYLEIHFDNKTIIMDDYKSLKGYGINIKEMNNSISEKGQLEELEALYGCLNGETISWPIPLEEILETTELTFLV
jgi:predicted dehydrogenase/threonine dehydrogenase-like Zn-dependent dehydrogenase